jgi:choline dehydrogenase
VRTEAFVMKIDMEGTRATGVTYRRCGVTQTTRANAEIVLSAGAVATPQLLMLSGIGPVGHLREHGIDVKADVAGVGQNLQDHPVSWVLFYTKDTTDLIEFLSIRNVLKAQKAGRGPLTSAEAGAFVQSRADMAAPDLQFHMAPSGFYCGLHEPVRRGLSIGSTLVRVESTGYIKLRSADPTWHPEIDPGYYADGADLDAMIAGYRRVYDVGTCAMGTVEGSVVDPELKVYGVEGLRIADASVMPRIPRGNTNAPTIMVGEKCADLIKESR